MESYKNINGNSGIIAYQVEEDYIAVKFRAGRWTLYTYTYASAGSSVIEIMKELARRGYGLNSYISTRRPKYSSKV